MYLLGCVGFVRKLKKNTQRFNNNTFRVPLLIHYFSRLNRFSMNVLLKSLIIIM